MNCCTETPTELPEKLKIGIRGVDDDHRILLSLVREVEEAITHGHGKEVTHKALDTLVAYVRVHFNREERILRHHQFPDLAAHKAAHDSFARQTMEYFVDVQGGVTDVSQDMLAYLKKWIVEHIMGMDQEYGEYLRERGVR